MSNAHDEVRTPQEGVVADQAYKVQVVRFFPKESRAEPAGASAADASERFEQVAIDCRDAGTGLESRAEADGVTAYHVVIIHDARARASKREMEKGFERVIALYSGGRGNEVRQGPYTIIIDPVLSSHESTSTIRSRRSSVRRSREERGEETLEQLREVLARLRPMADADPDLARRSVDLLESSLNDLRVPGSQPSGGQDEARSLRVIRVREAAEILDLSKIRVQQLAKEGRIGELVGSRYLFSLEELEAFKQLDRPAGKPRVESPKPGKK